MRKINFAGGEPFLYPRHLGQLVKFCKNDLKLESVSIVTNGSLVKQAWIEQYGSWLDILAVSCDSFNEATNIKIGRGKGNHLECFKMLRELCDNAGIKFKVNTVVNRFNLSEDMSGPMKEIGPFRWKAFQVLVVPGENDSEATIRDARRFVIADDEFKAWCKRHENVESLVPEDNSLMRSSYLILDEHLRFLDHKRGSPGKSILQGSVKEAMEAVYWDEDGFHARGGIYDWTKKTKKEDDGPLDW
jgi:radical S-adenosyl methionine domain-containing protein 2